MEEFGFENYEFSDSVLRIEIFPDDCLDFKSDSESNLFETGNSSDATSSVKVTTLSICSPVLAAKSPFFHKLFKNGMKESQDKNFTLRINASEKSGLMDVLNFMYCFKLRATTIPELLKVLIVADKFEVTCCMRYCCDLLLKLPMTLESAIEYLDLPPAVLMDESTRPLKDAANKFKSEMYNLKENAISLSLSDVEILLSSNELRVQSEDHLFDFINRWSSEHYPNVLEARETRYSLCARFLRFHYLSFDTLNRILKSGLFDPEKAREALFFKAGLPYLEQQQPQQQKPRIYEWRPLKLHHFHYSRPHCVVFLDLKKDECKSLSPDKHISSENFSLSAGGETKTYFCLKIGCRKDEHGLMKLCLRLHNWDKYVRAYCSVEFELAVMMKNLNSSNEYKLLYSSWRNGSVGWEIEWSEFIAGDSPYFTHDIVRFRAEVELKPRGLV